MIDILIPLGAGSRINDQELRFCLRSVEKHLTGVGNVFIVGEKPNWLKNVIHIPFRESNNSWERSNNIYRKIMAGINYDGKLNIGLPISEMHTVTSSFLFMNDDHFILQNYEAEDFPYYHRGLINTNQYAFNQPQVKQMLQTINLFDKPVKDFDIHCPIVYNKDLFRYAFLNKPWPEYGYGIKSVYCAEYDIEGEQIEDLKFREPVMKESIYLALAGRPWFSTGDKCFKGAMLEVLNELFPNKSKYEND